MTNIYKKYIKYIFGDDYDLDFKEEIAIYILDGERPGPPPDIIDGMSVIFNKNEYYIGYFYSDRTDSDKFLAKMNKKEFAAKFFYNNIDSGIFIGIKESGKFKISKVFGENVWKNVVKSLSDGSDI